MFKRLGSLGSQVHSRHLHWFTVATQAARKTRAHLLALNHDGVEFCPPGKSVLSNTSCSLAPFYHKHNCHTDRKASTLKFSASTHCIIVPLIAKTLRIAQTSAPLRLPLHILPFAKPAPDIYTISLIQTYPPSRHPCASKFLEPRTLASAHIRLGAEQ